MNYIIDLVILLCLGWGAYIGFKKGFIIKSLSIFSLILAVWGGFKFAGKLEPLMKEIFQMTELVCSIISFIIVFLLILILVYFSGFLLTKLVQAAALGMINRLSGAAFCIFINALALSLVIIIFNRINDKRRFIEPEKIEKTYLYKPVGRVAPAVIPEAFFEKIFK